MEECLMAITSFYLGEDILVIRFAEERCMLFFPGVVEVFRCVMLHGKYT